MRKLADMPHEYAIVLQQLDEDGGEDFNNLVETLQFERPRLAHIVRSLQHKGLVRLRGDGQRGFWVHLSRKGERLLRYLWPESGKLQPGF